MEPTDKPLDSMSPSPLQPWEADAASSPAKSLLLLEDLSPYQPDPADSSPETNEGMPTVNMFFSEAVPELIPVSSAPSAPQVVSCVQTTAPETLCVDMQSPVPSSVTSVSASCVTQAETPSPPLPADRKRKADDSASSLVLQPAAKSRKTDPKLAVAEKLRQISENIMETEGQEMDKMLTPKSANRGKRNTASKAAEGEENLKVPVRRSSRVRNRKSRQADKAAMLCSSAASLPGEGGVGRGAKLDVISKTLDSDSSFPKLATLTTLPQQNAKAVVPGVTHPPLVIKFSLASTASDEPSKPQQQNPTKPKARTSRKTPDALTETKGGQEGRKLDTVSGDRRRTARKKRPLKDVSARTDRSLLACDHSVDSPSRRADHSPGEKGPSARWLSHCQQCSGCYMAGDDTPGSDVEVVEVDLTPGPPLRSDLPSRNGHDTWSGAAGKGRYLSRQDMAGVLLDDTTSEGKVSGHVKVVGGSCWQPDRCRVPASPSTPMHGKIEDEQASTIEEAGGEVLCQDNYRLSPLDTTQHDQLGSVASPYHEGSEGQPAAQVHERSGLFTSFRHGRTGNDLTPVNESGSPGVSDVCHGAGPEGQVYVLTGVGSLRGPVSPRTPVSSPPFPASASVVPDHRLAPLALGDGRSPNTPDPLHPSGATLQETSCDLHKQHQLVSVPRPSLKHLFHDPDLSSDFSHASTTTRKKKDGGTIEGCGSVNQAKGSKKDTKSRKSTQQRKTEDKELNYGNQGDGHANKQEKQRQPCRKEAKRTQKDDTEIPKKPKKSSRQSEKKKALPASQPAETKASRGRRNKTETLDTEDSSSQSAPDHHWVWAGDPEIRPVANVDKSKRPVLRRCYPAIRHAVCGEVIQVRDCVIVRSGDDDEDLPYVAKVGAFWEHPNKKDMMMSVLWYYHPVEAWGNRTRGTQTQVRPDFIEQELYATKHRDECSIACIEGKAYVLTLSCYCRYKAEQRRLQQNVLYRSVVPPLAPHLRKNVVDDGVDPAAVFFCWQVYDIYKRKLWKSAKSNRFVQNRDADNG